MYFVEFEPHDTRINLSSKPAGLIPLQSVPNRQIASTYTLSRISLSGTPNVNFGGRLRRKRLVSSILGGCEFRVGVGILGLEENTSGIAGNMGAMGSFDQGGTLDWI
jgi:hypothetical protein